MSALLELDNIGCGYDGERVVEDLSLSLTEGDICCLLGPSGCGKTTVLRAIAGFLQPSAGRIELAGQLLASAEQSLAPEQRRVGMVFQDYALFPHLNVRDNLTFGLKNQSAREKARICDELLQLVKLEDLGHRYPHELSGGQQQRIALARALAPEPKLLLMDEPFSSLDVELRRALALEVRAILKERGITAIMVTHDQSEAFAMADRIGVLNAGQLQQWDTPFNLYHEPATRFVANFVGQGVFLAGYLLDRHTVRTELGDIEGNRCYEWLENTPVDILLRPDDVIHDDSSDKRAEVVAKVFAGTATLYTLQLPTGSRIQSAFPSHHDYAIGDHVGIRIEADHLIVFRREEQAVGGSHYGLETTET
ncbi:MULTISPECIES: ABC transporter ATP-binding protein [unclassified Marinimicrobium]|jgi:iron(III) transport system ATP-binding protein|uniref:ABC transporter ATP-binding protein n=1 Tax=unclassified Marinimicrobium TaxID=2632100 RepID=UPI000C60ABD4|nr:MULTISPECIES: ABC transporter ATP-binding protein [unclassified Marinimicrobium]MAN52783.1 iron ABC transporter ATP-binding protein [Marinimicrobium sp.]